MKIYKVSIATRKNIGALFITTEGKLLKKRVYKIPEDRAGNFYYTLIDTFEQSLRELKFQLYSDKSNDEIKVIFEINNQAFIKWINDGYSKDEYNDKFINIMNQLNSLPIIYAFSYQQRTSAYPYASEKYITKENKLSTNFDDYKEETESTTDDSNEGAILVKATKLSGVESLFA